MRSIALAVMLLGAAGARAQFRANITVERILIDARVTDASGNPIRDLQPGDFVVTLGGEPVEVESAEWVADDVAPGREVEPPGSEDATPAGRLFVIFVQTDHARESFRLRGQINFIRHAKKMIAGFRPEDRLAVFQFDSHLKFRLDFTDDKEAVNRALEDTILTSIPPPPGAGEPSLLPYLDHNAMHRTWHTETALTMIGKALRNIPGPKSILLLGWGLGVRSGSGAVHMRWKDYGEAVRALRESRTTVFSLDVAWADFHDLAAGLQQLAADTGGYYASTFRFPQLAVRRLERTLGGHYELVLIRPSQIPPGAQKLDVRVKRGGYLHVLAAPSWTLR